MAQSTPPPLHPTKMEGTTVRRNIANRGLEHAKKKLLFTLNKIRIRKHELNLAKAQQDKYIKLKQLAKALVKPGLGILSADESLRQIDNLLRDCHQPDVWENRWRLHDVYLGGTVDLRKYLSGILVREQTMCQLMAKKKMLFNRLKEQNVSLGIRVDGGVQPLAGTLREYTTSGFDTLQATCKRVSDAGAVFALWRCVYRISPSTPSSLAIIENSNTMAKFAAAAQTFGLVPIVSPEVLQDGDYDYEEARRALTEILCGLVKALQAHRVFMDAVLVRISPASPGLCFKGTIDLSLVARNTAKTLNQSLPPAIAGVVLAREQNFSRSLNILNELHNVHIKKPIPVSFCFSQIIQYGVLLIWGGNDKNLEKARAEFMKRLKNCSLATFGQIQDTSISLFDSAFTCPY